MAVATEREYLLFINGETSEPSGGDVKELLEPATGEALAKVAMATEADVDRAVDAARAALDGDWGRTPPTERSRLLHALADALVANRKELAELEVRNVGKALSSVKAELNQAVENFRFYASAIASIAGRSNPLGGSVIGVVSTAVSTARNSRSSARHSSHASRCERTRVRSMSVLSS